MEQKNDNSTQKIGNERALEVIKTVTDDNLAELYAKYSNELLEKAGNGISEEEYGFLLETTVALRAFIVQNYMLQNGYLQSSSDEINRWEKM